MKHRNKDCSKRVKQKDEIQKFRNALNRGISVKPQNSLKMRISHQGLDKDKRHQPDDFCLGLWDDTMPDWIGDDLRDDLVDALRGFNEDLALEITDNVIDCWCGTSLHSTGIKHVDALLWQLYAKILNRAHVMGIKLEYRH